MACRLTSCGLNNSSYQFRQNAKLGISVQQLRNRRLLSVYPVLTNAMCDFQTLANLQYSCVRQVLHLLNVVHIRHTLRHTHIRTHTMRHNQWMFMSQIRNQQWWTAWRETEHTVLFLLYRYEICTHTWEKSKMYWSTNQKLTLLLHGRDIIQRFRAEAPKNF